IERCVWLRTSKTQFTANACHFHNFDNSGAGSPAIQLDTGTAILQGNTFAKSGTHVVVEAPVRSAIILGNQATGGVVVENRAGSRTQLVANQVNPIQWTKKRLSHYNIFIGADGDGPYVQDWHPREESGDWASERGAMRWSTPKSTLRLPVRPGRRYTITLEMNLPQAAITPDAGLYLDGERVVAFPETPGLATVTGKLPPAKEDYVTLTVRSGNWVPAEKNPDSTDRRTLGLALRRVTMRTGHGSTEVFNANTGE
ncbi:MAG: hypothetical protein HYV26_14150, partial [Candidatus Hydrogenedentes bacterium]|nr:hypothetical protein [Candidatus Hydrogenedentota bacterium]